MENSLANKIKRFLSGKKVTITILILAIAGRLMQVFYFFNIRSDRSFQMLATDNLLHGNGISLARVSADDLSTIIYSPLINWPPGYSLLIAPFYTLFNHNYIQAGLTLDIISSILLILVSRSILKILNTPVYLVNIYTLSAGFFIYDFYFISSTDAIAITFFIIALYYTLLFLKKNGQWIKAATGITVFLFICGSLKYIFIPVIFIIPLFLTVKGFVDHEVRTKKLGTFSFLILLVSFGGLLLYQKYISGSAAYVSNAPYGFFPENLLAAHPFFPGSFIKPATIALLLSRRPAVQSAVFYYFQWGHLLFIFFVLICMLRMFYRRGYKKITVTDSFFYLAFFISLSVTLVLGVLSVTVGKVEETPGNFWTFIQEPRYYGLVNVLIHLAVFIFYHYQLKSSRILKYAFYFFLLLLLPETLRGIIFNVKRVANFNKEEYSWQYENRLQKHADAIIKKVRQENPLKKTVVTSSSFYISNRVSLFSHIPVLYELGKINDLNSLKTKDSVVLFIIMNKNDSAVFQPFLTMKEKESAGDFNGFSFYTVNVIPLE